MSAIQQDRAGADILRQYHVAMIAKSADALADLYCVDAVHELPFAHRPDASMIGQHTIRARYRAGWAAAPVQVRAINNVLLHHAPGTATWIAEQDLDLINSQTGLEFVAGAVLVFTLRDGKIARMRDYSDNLTIAQALGRIPSIA